jgi:tryptophanyl-tRNA synthetase
MNIDYGTDFPQPQRFKTTGEYVPSLTGAGKMSKSVEGSFINLTDSLSDIQKKLAAAPTDSGKEGGAIPKEGGVANLFAFLKLFGSEASYTQYEQDYKEKRIRYGEVKAYLSQAIFAELEPLQEKRKELEANTKYVDKVIREGAEKARAVASETVKEVKEKMGLF